MTTGLTPVRGMNDVLPEETPAWQRLERIARETLTEYGYRELRLPLLERTELFKRSIGEYTDIVEKEMYTFEDRGGDSVTLRPEATAGVVRACISNGLLHNQRQKLWCHGPMFRYERPQKGRYRQFHQIDAEAIGYAGPDVDAELILISARIWRRLGLTRLSLNLNTLGTAESRRGYRALLTEYFRSHAAALDEDSRRRLEGNPLRILDSKNPAMHEIVADAPLITDHLDPESEAAFFHAACASRCGGRVIYVEPAPGARARLLFAHRLRMDHDGPGCAGCGLLRRALRRSGGATGRRADARNRLGTGPGTRRRADAAGGAGCGRATRRRSTCCSQARGPSAAGSRSRSVCGTRCRDMASRPTAAGEASSRR